jgi:hypothetical protein
MKVRPARGRETSMTSLVIVAGRRSLFSIAVSSVDSALPVWLNDVGLATPNVHEGGSLAGNESAKT